MFGDGVKISACLVESTKARNIEYSLSYLASDCYSSLHVFYDCDILHCVICFVAIKNDLSIYLSICTSYEV